MAAFRHPSIESIRSYMVIYNRTRFDNPNAPIRHAARSFAA